MFRNPIIKSTTFYYKHSIFCYNIGRTISTFIDHRKLTQYVLLTGCDYFLFGQYWTRDEYAAFVADNVKMIIRATDDDTDDYADMIYFMTHFDENGVPTE